MPLLPTGTNQPVRPVESLPLGEIKHIFASLGSVSGTDLNQTAGGAVYVIDQSVAPESLSHLDISHDGMSGGAGHSIQITFYKVPSTVSVPTAIYAGSTYQLGETVSVAHTASPGRVNYSLDRETPAGRQFSRGDRLVAVFRSIADSATQSYYSTSMANVCIAGLSVTGKHG